MDLQSEPESSISSDDEEPAAPAITTTTSIAPTTIIDSTDGYADADAALAFGSILNVHKGVYFNVPLTPTDGITVYYVTRGCKIGVFSGWNSVGPWVTSVSGALYAKAKTVNNGIETVITALKAGVAVKV
ncbi:uncharacterized protein BJ212DRAFT_1474869 [Suillus subaureus]|uniref:Uncharacterized protein n=1 Tax=Suillus subaureus TaxID=48587 RepID=A0A9P7EMJ2_9AGAM|nr:uncharacterized protein BJ212DRAFT_1474869 [Suillus subaureus]KAG1825474.1 hypothetical protein BJ212DRAFT_1474869 [Suillus subaureus]